MLRVVVVTILWLHVGLIISRRSTNTGTVAVTAAIVFAFPLPSKQPAAQSGEDYGDRTPNGATDDGAQI